MQLEPKAMPGSPMLDNLASKARQHLFDKDEPGFVTSAARHVYFTHRKALPLVQTAAHVVQHFGQQAKPLVNRVHQYVTQHFTHAKGKTAPQEEDKPTPGTNPNPEMRAIAASYGKKVGLPDAGKPQPYYGVDEARGKQLADHFDQAKHQPDHPEVKASYDALKHEVGAQWDHLTRHGVKFERWHGHGEPYKNSDEMQSDLRTHKHLYFFPTEHGFGQSDGQSKPSHPMLEDSGRKLDGKPLVYNDVFRAVHDAFGHGKEGYQFGPRGEENAWRAHAAMFTPKAHMALAAETRAQNSWVNYGPHLRRSDGTVPKKGEEGYVHPADRPFAEQKAVAIPHEFSNPAIVTPAQQPKLGIGKSMEHEYPNHNWPRLVFKASTTLPDRTNQISHFYGREGKRLSYEVAPGSHTESEAHYPPLHELPYDAAERITNRVGAVMNKHLPKTGVKVHSIQNGAGGWEDYPISPSLNAEVSGSDKHIHHAAALLGYMGDQTSVLVSRPKVGGKQQGVAIYEHGDKVMAHPQHVQEFWKRVTQKAPALQTGFQPVHHNGHHGIAIMNLSDKPEEQWTPAHMEHFGRAISETADEMGMKLHRPMTGHFQTNSHLVSNDWGDHPHGEGFKAHLKDSGMTDDEIEAARNEAKSERAAAFRDEARRPGAHPLLAPFAKSISDMLLSIHESMQTIAKNTLSKADKYKYGSTQVNLPGVIRDQFKDWAKKNVRPADLTEDGVEDQPHITIKYGLKNDDPQAVARILGPMSPLHAKLGKMKLFDTHPDHDVLVVEVESPDLHNANQAVKQGIDCDDTWPTYKPHATIAYFKKGKADKFKGNADFEGTALAFGNAFFSDRNKKQHYIRFKGEQSNGKKDMEKSIVPAFLKTEADGTKSKIGQDDVRGAVRQGYLHLGHSAMPEHVTRLIGALEQPGVQKHLNPGSVEDHAQGLVDHYKKFGEHEPVAGYLGAIAPQNHWHRIAAAAGYKGTITPPFKPYLGSPEQKRYHAWEKDQTARDDAAVQARRGIKVTVGVNKAMGAARQFVLTDENGRKRVVSEHEAIAAEHAGYLHLDRNASSDHVRHLIGGIRKTGGSGNIKAEEHAAKLMHKYWSAGRAGTVADYLGHAAHESQWHRIAAHAGYRGTITALNTPGTAGSTYNPFAIKTTKPANAYPTHPLAIAPVVPPTPFPAAMKTPVLNPKLLPKTPQGAVSGEKLPKAPKIPGFRWKTPNKVDT